MGNEKALYLNSVFPDESFLKTNYKAYESMKDTCIFVLDTNILLSPYRASPKSFDDIKSIYEKLKTSNRMRVPFRALQEYAKNRGVCLKEQYSHFDNLNNSTVKKLDAEIVVPLLQNNAHLTKLNDLSQKINDLLDKRALEISAILNDIKGIYWNDPIFQFYRGFINDSMICKLPEADMSSIAEEMRVRYDCDVPPGFADSSKKDGGIGDLIIWKTILSLGSDHDIVFVSNDRNKEDWFYVVSTADKKKTPVAPRFELLVEFYRNNPGHGLDFMDFTTFLEVNQAQKETLHELEINLDSPYALISEEVFIQELNEAYCRFNSTGGFLASKYFIETYLANKDYDIRASWNIYYSLKEKGYFREYRHQDQNGLYPPQNAILIP